MFFNTSSYIGALEYAGTDVVKYDLSYPEFHGALSAGLINSYNRRLANYLLQKAEQSLYKNAVRQYKILIKYNSFTQLEIKNHFDIMHNSSNMLSLFWDIYISKGSEGCSMKRLSQNWEIKNGNLFSVSSLFKRNSHWREPLFKELSKQVKLFETEMGTACYPGWEHMLTQSINSGKFYMSPEGLAIYCPQGSIASDIWGIPTFMVSFSHLEGLINKKLL